MAGKVEIVSGTGREILFLFNLSVSTKNETLSHSVDWINEFAQNFKEVFVYTMEGDVTNNVANFKSLEMLKAKKDDNATMVFIRCLKSLVTIYRYRKKASVFFHMNHKPVLVLGIFLRIWGIPSGLWYSHKRAPISLRLAHKLVDFVVSSVTDAFPIRSGKLIVTGHGLSKIFLLPINEKPRMLGIVHIGRVVPVKKIERIIFALGSLETQYRKIDLIGVTPNLRYKEFIEKIAAKLDVRIVFLGPMSKEKLSERLSHYSVCFSGTEMSVDKAPLEAASMGCYIVSNNDAVMKLTGMDLLLNNDAKNSQRSKSLEGLLNEIYVKTTFDNIANRHFISAKTRESNCLEKTVARISNQLKVR